MKIYVIAGTYHEAQSWIAKNYQERVAIGDQQVSTSDYVYVSKAQDLRGIKDPHGMFVGNWMGRPDILDIVEQLIMCSRQPNAALGKIHKDLTPKVRPTPKKPSTTGKTYESAIIDEAASLFAKEIDAEVMKQYYIDLNGGDMTNRYKEVREAIDSLRKIK